MSAQRGWKKALASGSPLIKRIHAAVKPTLSPTLSPAVNEQFREKHKAWWRLGRTFDRQYHYNWNLDKDRRTVDETTPVPFAPTDPEQLEKRLKKSGKLPPGYRIGTLTTAPPSDGTARLADLRLGGNRWSSI